MIPLHLISGAPKLWYIIPRTENEKLEEALKKAYNSSYKKCPSYHRHKQLSINPTFLQKNQIKFVKVTQYHGEIIFLNHGVYHFGMNCGPNLSGSVNYAGPEWKKHLIECINEPDCPECPTGDKLKCYISEKTYGEKLLGFIFEPENPPKDGQEKSFEPPKKKKCPGKFEVEKIKELFESIENNSYEKLNHPICIVPSENIGKTFSINTEKWKLDSGKFPMSIYFGKDWSGKNASSGKKRLVFTNENEDFEVICCKDYQEAKNHVKESPEQEKIFFYGEKTFTDKSNKVKLKITAFWDFKYKNNVFVKCYEKRSGK